MNRSLKLVSAMLAFGLIAAVQVVRAQTPKTQTVEFPSGKEKASGFLVVPDKPGPYSALIVVHEWWGLNDWVRSSPKSWPNRVIWFWPLICTAARPLRIPLKLTS